MNNEKVKLRCGRRQKCVIIAQPLSPDRFGSRVGLGAQPVAAGGVEMPCRAGGPGRGLVCGAGRPRAVVALDQFSRCQQLVRDHSQRGGVGISSTNRDGNDKG